MRTDEEIDAASAAAARATAAKTKTKAKAKAKAANKAKSKAKPTKTKAKAAAKAVYEKQTADRSRATVLIGAGNKGVYVSLEATGACGSSQKNTHVHETKKNCQQSASPSHGGSRRCQPATSHRLELGLKALQEAQNNKKSSTSTNGKQIASHKRCGARSSTRSRRPGPR